MTGFVRLTEPGASAIAPSFDTPFAMLAECHRKVQAQCALLQRLVPYLAAHGVDQAAREAAETVLRYFDLAAPKHHADEEEDLFPALIESMAGSDAVCLHDIIAALGSDHESLERRWSSIRVELLKVTAGVPVALDETEVYAFADQYAAHIAREEREVLPMAERLLSADAIEQIGRSMRRRRDEGRA
ncbi:MAG: hemerythrin domain-containing protein [Burkholderiaceae bacterium]